MQRDFIKKLANEGFKPIEIKSKLDIQFGKSALCLKSVYNWFNLFKLGYEGIEDDDRSGRPYDEQLAIAIDHTLEEEPYSSIRYIAHKINSNPATVYRYVTIYLQRVYKHSKYVPHFLDEIQKAKRVNECTLLLGILTESEKLGFINIFTGDEYWFYIKFNRKGAWILPDEKVPFFENPRFQMSKFMLTVFWVNKRYPCD